MIEKPKGTNDFLHPESTIREKISQKIKQLLDIFGYKPIETPIFEHLELFKRSAGISSDIVSKEMYEFQDKKGRHLSLRPEITAPIVRAIIQNNLIQNQPIIKLYYIGSIFRYEKPQKDRYRQATQFGIEFFGIENPFADLETILICNKIYNLFDINPEIHLNSIGCLECRPNYRNQIYNYFQQYKEKLCKDCQRRLEENPLRILDCKNPTCKEISKQAPKSIDYLCQQCKTHFNKLTEYLSFYNISFQVNPLLVRGLDYYNRTVFEIKYQDVDLAGGGRYDYLTQLISDGKYNIPAIGFAGGLERLTNTLSQNIIYHKLIQEKIKINIVSLSDKSDKIVLSIFSKISDKINENKEQFEIYLSKYEDLSKALKISDKLKFNFVLFIGEEEINKNEITIKNLETGKQIKINIEKFLTNLYQEIKNLTIN